MKNTPPGSRILAALILVAGLLHAGDPAPPEPVPATDPRIAEGRRIVQRTFGILSSNVLEAIRIGGVPHAVEFCSTRAAALTHSDVARVRRLSHKPRNPANRAGTDDLEVLAGFRTALGSGRVPEPLLRTNETGIVSFYAPIVLGSPLCLQCHGEPGREIRPSTAEAIGERYPDDAATGFRLGDLRGIWRVDFPAGED